MSYDKCQVRFHFSFSLSLSHALEAHSRNTHYPQMLSDVGDDGNNLSRKQHHLSRVTRRTTTLSSSSSSSSSSSFSPSSTLNQTRTMEEVWKDINLSSLYHTSDHHSSGNNPAAVAIAGYRGFILQDFLAKPFSSNDIPTSVSSPGYGSPSPPPPPPATQPPMLLNLNTGPDQMNFLGDDPTRDVCPLDGPFDQVMANSNSSSGLLANNIGGMRMLPATDRTGGDRRHKRMIKNRESAARSRARKQAYTNELENEVERLKEENARLKRQQQQLQIATAAQTTKKRSLQRTSTAPF